MADGYTPITSQERSAYLEFLGSNPKAAKIKDKDLLSPSYSGKYEEVNMDDLYALHAPNLSYYGTNYGPDSAEGYIANLVVQGYASPAIKKEVDRLEAEGKLDSTRTKKDYYSDVDTLVKENRTVDYYHKQADPYYKAGIPNPNQSYTPDDLPEFKAAVEAARMDYRTKNPPRPNIVLEADPTDKTGKRKIAKAGTGFSVDPGEEQYISQFVTQNQQLLNQIGLTPYNDEMLRRKGTVLGYGK
jgi:hypothetical protein